MSSQVPPKIPDHPIPSSAFTKKKTAILSSISTYSSPGYTDKSPKGSIDAEIIDLIDEINAFEGYVTTSSCAGRVAVFVEGQKEGDVGARVRGREGEGSDDGGNWDRGRTSATTMGEDSDIGTRAGVGAGAVAGPGGKGHGNKWLYVSHSPIPTPAPPPKSSFDSAVPSPEYSKATTSSYYHDLFGLSPLPSPSTSVPDHTHTYPPATTRLRLIKLTFSPLILHVLCSSLHTAKPLLAAAINAGFRESGVQSLKALDDEDCAGVMLAIRTAGCAFETVVGYVDAGVGQQQAQQDEIAEVYRSVVAEAWLDVCASVVAGRFEANVERRERLRGELRRMRHKEGNAGKIVTAEGKKWEDKEVRRQRKREEGLRLKAQKGQVGSRNGDETLGQIQQDGNAADHDALGDGLFLDST